MNTTVETLDEQQHNYEYNVVLFYKYFPLTESEQVQFIDELKYRCEQNNMLGRILIAGEGMNGTLAGTCSSTNTFCEQISSFLLQRHGIINIDWKFSIDRGSEPPFLNLSIRQMKEIVGTGSTSEFLKSVIRYDASAFGGISNSGQHLNAQQFHNALSTANDNKIVLDIRNQFEYDIGHFEGSVNLATYTYSETFSALDKTLAGRALEPSQPIYMYCTGGIRCEKASAYLSAKGYQNVFQLQGGIHRYMEAFPHGGKFLGKNFVFDGRVSVAPPLLSAEGEVEAAEEVAEGGGGGGPVVGRCIDCQRPCDRYSGRNVCTVCRMPVLVCVRCVEQNIVALGGGRAVGEFHCYRHRDLKDLYFTALDCFSGAELQRQSDCLQQMLTSNLASSSRVASTQSQPSCSKNRRRTLRKQLEKIRLRMQQMSNEHGGGLGQGHVHREEKNPNDRVGSGFWRS